MKFKVYQSEILNENIFVNRENIEKDVDKFQSGENNVLLITGFSGSGKSTLANQIAKEYNCQHFELDVLSFYFGNTISLESIQYSEPGLYEFITQNNIKQTLPRKSDYTTVYVDYINFLINWCKEQQGIYIIEGLQIYEFFDQLDKSIFDNTSIIIMGTSGLTSALQGSKRNSEGNVKYMFKELPRMIKWMFKDNKKLNNFTDNQMVKLTDEQLDSASGGLEEQKENDY